MHLAAVLTVVSLPWLQSLETCLIETTLLVEVFKLGFHVYRGCIYIRSAHIYSYQRVYLLVMGLHIFSFVATPNCAQGILLNLYSGSLLEILRAQMWSSE